MVKEGVVEQVDLKSTDAAIRVFIGKVSDGQDAQDWYATDPRGNEIDTPNHQDLEDKTIYYIRVQ